MTPRDALGNPINVGDKIVYAAADGRSSVLRRGVVISTFKEPQLDHAGNPVVSRFDGRAKFTERVKVEGEEYRSGTWRPQRKKVTLSFPTRILVVDSNAW